MTFKKNLLKTDSSGNIVVEASKEKRLINFIVDTSVWLFLLSLMGYLASEFTSIGYIFEALIWVLVLGAYSIVSEFLFQKTIGKFLTKTKVVFKKDVKPEFRLIVIRTWARAIPFEFLSLGLGIDAKAWHDVLSKTMVVNDN